MRAVIGSAVKPEVGEDEKILPPCHLMTFVALMVWAPLLTSDSCGVGTIARL